MKKLLPLILSVLCFPLLAEPKETMESKNPAQVVNRAFYKAKDYSNLIGMKGFSNDALKLHFKLYQGYVTNLNQLLNILNQYSQEGKDRTPQYSELKRRLMWEFDGMRLHEYYFDNLGGQGSSLAPEDALARAIEQDFGSYEAWKNDFIATGAMRGIGWAVLYFDPISKKLVNAWINEHDVGHMAGGHPILIMDVFEHAYMMDYGIERIKYIDAFFSNIDWTVASKRFSDPHAKHS